MQKDQNGPSEGREKRVEERGRERKREGKDRELGAAYKSCQRWERKDSNKTKKKTWKMRK